MDKKAVRTGPQSMEMVPVCRNDECRHPVDGEPVPCQIARQEVVFCGFQAKHWKKKEEDPNKPSTLVQIT